MRKALAVGLTAFLAACASVPPSPTPGPDPRPTPPASGPSVFPSGWAEDDHAAAYAAYRRTCRTARAPAAKAACADALAGPENLSAADARAFFERRFRFERVDGQGLLTAYFAPEYEARRRPDPEFSQPVRPKPADLEVVEGSLLSPDLAGRRVVAQRAPDGTLQRYPTRAEIEAAPGQALAWMQPEEYFFMQIQGSGFLTFPDGSRMRAAYAADNGRTFVGVARPMVERGLLPQNGTSGDAILAWLAANRGPRAQEIMNLNPRYAFFVAQADDGREPAGAAGLPLPVRRSIAVDPTKHAMGDLLWIDAEGGNLVGATRSYRGLMVALDTGGAIKGEVRADLYMGRGKAAGDEAGRVRHPLTLWRLVPR